MEFKRRRIILGLRVKYNVCGEGTQVGTLVFYTEKPKVWSYRYTYTTRMQNNYQ